MSPRVVKPGAIGQLFSRVDGRLKTTGKATFAAEYKVDDVTHGALVFSRIARGKIKNIDTRAAATAPGVLSVLTHENAPAMKPTALFGEESEQPGVASSSIQYLNTDEIYFYGQPIAVIVAETLEQAEHAATLVTVDYEEQEAKLSLMTEKSHAVVPANVLGESADLHLGDAAALWLQRGIKWTTSTARRHTTTMRLSCTRLWRIGLKTKRA